MSNAIGNWIAFAREKLAAGSFSERELQDLESLIAEPRQQILYLLSRCSDMRSPLCGWRLYDPAVQEVQVIPSQDPPYGSVLDAIRDGWRVLQVPLPQSHPFSAENTYVGYEFVLEKVGP